MNSYDILHQDHQKSTPVLSALQLENLASERAVKLFYSGAVGGAMPALETVSLPEFSDDLKSFFGVVNCTCNFICDELAKGVEYAAAVEAAKEAGYAEDDPALDLSGTDAAQKTILLARAAFGATLSFQDIQRQGIENLSAARAEKAARKNRVVRLVAGCRRTRAGIEAFVKPLELSLLHPFAQTRGAENCLRLETDAGEIKFVRGTGAGRWATTESVVADLLDLRRQFAPAVKHRIAQAARISFTEATAI